MNKLAVKPLHTEDFHSRVTMADGVITLTLKGCADLRVWRGLGEMLDEIHEHVRRLAVGRVVVDVTDLEFMNSSCFKSIVSWLTNILELPEAEQYRVHFVSNPSRLWQRRSLHALRSFALMIVTVET